MQGLRAEIWWDHEGVWYHKEVWRAREEAYVGGEAWRQMVQGNRTEETAKAISTSKEAARDWITERLDLRENETHKLRD